MAVAVTIGKIVDLLVKVPSEMLVTIYHLLEKMMGTERNLWHENLKQFLKMELGSDDSGPFLVPFLGDERSSTKKLDPIFSIYELVRNANFRTMFESGPEKDLSLLCLRKEQIEHFVSEYEVWLRNEGYATFFLFKEENQFFVRSIRLYKSGTKIHDDLISDKYIWPAEGRYRLVVRSYL